MKDLITPTLNGIVDALHGINPDAEIYIDKPINTKPSSEGFFYIQFPFSIVQESYLQDFHRLRLAFDVSYFPPDLHGDNSILLSQASYAIAESLRVIYPADFVQGEYKKSELRKRCFGLHTEIVDGVSHVIGAYDIFVDIEKAKEIVHSLTISLKK